MRKFLLLAILLPWVTNAFACYDKSLSDEEDFIRCKNKAEQGDTRAQHSLFVMYQKGHGVARNYSEALRWEIRAAEGGYIEAQTSLAMLYDPQSLQLEPDKKFGITRNNEEAFKWYAASALQGDTSSQFTVGLMFHEGRGAPSKDGVEAVKWFRLAAEKNDRFVSDAPQFYLGLAYWKGEGVPKDEVLAYMWVNIASAGGNSTIIESRDKIAKNITPLQLQEAQKLTREWMSEHQ